MAHGEVPRGSRTHFQKCQNVLIYDDTPPEAKHEKISRSYGPKKHQKRETARLCHRGWKDASGGKWLSSLIHWNCCCWSRRVEFNSSQSVVKEFEETFGKVGWVRWWCFRAKNGDSYERCFAACQEQFIATAVFRENQEHACEVTAGNKTFEVNFAGFVFKWSGFDVNK